MSLKIDMESGERSICPVIHENLPLRWSFIRKVYSIITFQLLLTIVIVSAVVFVGPVANFFNNSTQGFVLNIVLIFLPLKGKVILEIAILTIVVVFSLTLYIFWAAKRGHDFNSLNSFLFGSLLILILLSLIQIMFPLENCHI
ncbi:unnamed protein product [Trifolium pratense]|uniref:Uncharacterized protein n=1 Tax=Trifolium pratense TaxID=57577 RepID=A0ACB0MB62_TRIPR|nr:unnamed protein product [Trifolium pratense]